jgi:hypothetical protein
MNGPQRLGVDFFLGGKRYGLGRTHQGRRNLSAAKITSNAQALGVRRRQRRGPWRSFSLQRDADDSDENHDDAA